MSEQRASRRSRNTLKERILSQIWLTIPVGIIVVVAVLAIINRPRSTPITTESPYAGTPSADASGSPSPNPMQSSAGTVGLIEEFTVTTPGEILPDRPADTVLPGKAFPDLGRKHVPGVDRITYNSNPPTSGPHHAVWAKWGIYEQAPMDEQLVHNLEHGGVIVSYDPAQISGETLEQLKAQVRELSKINPRIILTPRQNFDGAIALTAWGYLQTLDGYDAAAIKTFYDAFIARAPECTRGQCPG